jgi:hypothetical protein
MWSTNEGNAASLVFELDGEYMGQLDNLVSRGRSLSVEDLAVGQHTFALTDITVYGVDGFGQTVAMSRGASCVGSLMISRSGTLSIWARMDSFGRVACGMS